MSVVVFKTNSEIHEAMIDLLTSEKKGSLTNGILLALEQFFSPENIKNFPVDLYENILDEDLIERLKEGEDIVKLSLEFSEGKRVLAFREKKALVREEKRKKRKRMSEEKKVKSTEEQTDKISLSEMFGDDV